MRNVWIARLCVHAPSPLPADQKNGAAFPRFSFVEGSRAGCGYT